MALKDQIPAILQYIKDSAAFTEHNASILEIYEGNLKKYVYDVMRRTLSENYFNKIESRLVPVNILKRVIDKLSKVYADDPTRTSTNYQDFIDEYTIWTKLNEKGNSADEYANMFKGYAWEPYVYKGKPRIRTLPYDRFLVMSDDMVDPLNPTVFIKFMGKREKKNLRGRTNCNAYYVYTDQEFLAIDSDGEILVNEMGDTQGINPVGRIPFVYGNRSRIDLTPCVDSDIKQMAILLPTMLSDLGGAQLFQCFSIMYTIDVEQANLTMSPNALWDLKSDPKSDKTPQIGSVKPDVDSEKMLSYITAIFILWLETKGVRVGSIGSTTGSNVASGVSKIIDEMDCFEIRKTNITFFQNEEQELWSLLKDMNNYWVKSGQLNYQLIGDDFEVSVEFEEPKPYLTRQEELNQTILELNNGLITKEYAIERLYPEWSQEQVQEVLNSTEVINVQGAPSTQGQTSGGNQPY